MISTSEFNALNPHAKLDIVFHEAQYLAFVSADRTNFTLYQFNFYYVEHVYDHSTNMQTATAFQEGPQLDKYIAHINVQELFKTA